MGTLLYQIKDNNPRYQYQFFCMPLVDYPMQYYIDNNPHNTQIMVIE